MKSELPVRQIIPMDTLPVTLTQAFGDLELRMIILKLCPPILALDQDKE